ncbi:MAG TPA: HAD family hydrolase [Candidatus Krumholzibacteria bacterium]|nr:HAD family hydrolase [Candidatus Krumholzibacteria bacterium]HPD71733.1 HAD family hydrolase [Candidatus Krumholzibacteria bacterium]HRY41334.1 HAD family hydrolase [Candidatus Krumholzibacteria bacterium]
MSRWSFANARPPASRGVPALFVDRDGVIVVERDYLGDPAQLLLVPGATSALRAARAAGFLLVGVSNQSGLGRGRITHAQFAAVMRRFEDVLAAEDCLLDGFFYCPHAPGDGCRCRKPAPGLLEEAAEVFAWDPTRSWIVGDKVSDVDLALAAGLRPALVRTGYGRVEETRLGERRPVLVADDLAAVVAAILAEAAP